MPDFWVNFISRLLNGDPAQLESLIRQALLIVGAIIFSIQMVYGAWSKARSALQAKTGGGR